MLQTQEGSVASHQHDGLSLQKEGTKDVCVIQWFPEGQDQRCKSKQGVGRGLLRTSVFLASEIDHRYVGCGRAAAATRFPLLSLLLDLGGCACERLALVAG